MESGNNLVLKGNFGPLHTAIRTEGLASFMTKKVHKKTKTTMWQKEANNKDSMVNLPHLQPEGNPLLNHTLSPQALHNLSF